MSQSESGSDSTPSFGFDLPLLMESGANLTPQLPEYLVCVVCGDNASGRHYGAYSCEGCKGFFKRSTRKQLVYRCRLDGNCEVTKNDRNRCQHCRMQKCILMGMRNTFVQNERKPALAAGNGRRVELSKSNINAASSMAYPIYFPTSASFSVDGLVSNLTMTTNPSAMEYDPISSLMEGVTGEGMPVGPRSESESDDNENTLPTFTSALAEATRLISNVLEGKEDTNCSEIFAEIDVDSLVPEESIPFKLVVPNCNSSSTPTPTNGSVTMGYVKEAASRLLFLTVHWTRCLPVFQALSPEMQVSLMKSSWTQLFTIGFLQCQDSLSLSSVTTAILHHAKGGKSVSPSQFITAAEHLNKLNHFVKTCQFLNVDDFECAALKMLVLFSPDQVVQFGAPVTNAVRVLHYLLSKKLAEYLNEKEEGDENRLSELLLLLPQLRSIDASCLEATVFVSFVGSEKSLLADVIPRILGINQEEDQDQDSQPETTDDIIMEDKTSSEDSSADGFCA